MTTKKNKKNDGLPDTSKLRLVAVSYNHGRKRYVFMAPKATTVGDYLVVPASNQYAQPAIVAVVDTSVPSTDYTGPVAHAISRIPAAKVRRFTTMLAFDPVLGETVQDY